jgi:hypothetical protein
MVPADCQSVIHELETRPNGAAVSRFQASRCLQVSRGMCKTWGEPNVLKVGESSGKRVAQGEGGKCGTGGW